MYHAIVRAKLRRVFTQLNRREFEAMPALFTAAAEHRFPGAHALAGTRRSAATIRRWYERLPQALPDLQRLGERVVADHVACETGEAA